MTDETRVPAVELQEFTKGVFIAAGLPSEDAALEAEVLVWANLLRALPRAEGVAEVLVPGEPEDRSTEERRRRGIPLPIGTVENLRSVAARFRVPLPASL